MLKHIKEINKYIMDIVKNSVYCIVFILTISVSNAQEYNFQQLRERVFNSQSANIADHLILDNWVSTQNADGSWSDLEYGTLSTSVSIYDNHVHRLWNLAAACSKTVPIKHDETIYKNAVKKGLQYWYNSKTIDPNWWFNKIYFPKHLGEILIFMRLFDNYIPTTASAGIDEPEILSLFKPIAITDITLNGTGANAIDIATHYVYRALLSEDSKLLEDTKNKLESILTANITSNMVYQDHGPQIMIASYGLVYCEGLMRLVSYLANSPAAFDTKSPHFEMVLRFIRETQLSSIRGKSWDFSVLGRGVSRENATITPINYLQCLADSIDPVHAPEYLNALSRLNGDNPANYKVREFNKHYWDSDYTQHMRSSFLFTVRNTSSRTVESEVGNGENLKANYFSYGANFISVDGDEYKNIMPVWDWSMIPGTTYPHITSFPTRKNWGVNYGKTDFVGGISDGIYGVSVLDLDDAGIKAKKSWFFFDDEIVCLGAGITDNSDRNVRTTINQAWMETPSFSCEQGSTSEFIQRESDSVYSNTHLKYIRNGKIAYYFPNQGNVKYSMKLQSGSWYDINALEGSKEIKTGKVFSLWIDHGNNPLNSKYGYIVVPGIDSKDKAENYNANAIDIIENSSTKQAVYHKDLDVLQAIFHQAGTVVFGDKEVTVNKPCVLMFTRGTTLAVSNPSQTYATVLVTIKTKDKAYKQVVELPNTNETKGKTTIIDFQNKNKNQ
jgi:chondroitin AC lyase